MMWTQRQSACVHYLDTIRYDSVSLNCLLYSRPKFWDVIKTHSPFGLRFGELLADIVHHMNLLTYLSLSSAFDCWKCPIALSVWRINVEERCRRWAARYRTRTSRWWKITSVGWRRCFTCSRWVWKVGKDRVRRHQVTSVENQYSVSTPPA